MNYILIFAILFLLICFMNRGNKENFCNKIKNRRKRSKCKKIRKKAKNIKKLKRKYNSLEDKYNNLEDEYNDLEDDYNDLNDYYNLDNTATSNSAQQSKCKENDYYTCINGKRYHNHQLCLTTNNDDNVYRYTNYDKDWKDTIHKYIKKHPKRFFREKNTDRIWDIAHGKTDGKKCKDIPGCRNNDNISNNKKLGPRKLLICGDEDGNIKNNFDKTIDFQECTGLFNDSIYISKGNNFDKDGWTDGDVCNRVYNFKDRGFYKYGDGDLTTHGGCTTFSDNKCHRVSDKIGNLSNDAKKELEDEINKKI